MCSSSLRRTVRFLPSICLLASTLLPAHAQPRGPGEQGVKPGVTLQCASTADATPGGLAVVLPSGQRRDPRKYIEALNNPLMSGVALQVNWRELEPVQGR